MGRLPPGMPPALSTMAGGFAAPAIGEGQGAGQTIFGHLELAQQGKLALPRLGGLVPFGTGQIFHESASHAEGRHPCRILS
jgi:hypothetical protein